MRMRLMEEENELLSDLLITTSILTMRNVDDSVCDICIKQSDNLEY